MNKISQHIWYVVLTAAVLALGGCVSTKVANKAAEIEGHYKYEHTWCYDIDGNHVLADEEGTMTFYNDGYAIDYVRQSYVVTLQNGCKAYWTYWYFSPSNWRVEGDDFYFAGINSLFRLNKEGRINFYEDSCDNAEIRKMAGELEDRIRTSVRKKIGRETKFRYSKPTEKELVWSYTYPDGHTDTWEFYYESEATEKFRREPSLKVYSGVVKEIPPCP